MADITSTARSGISAAQLQLQAAANNIANLNTPGYKRQSVDLRPQANGGVAAAIRTSSSTSPDLAADLVTQLQAKNAFYANLAVFRTHDKMAGALFDKNA